MPTAKPRLQVTLTTPQHELLRRLAKLQGRSMSAVLAELFEQVYPVLERVAVVLQAAVRAQESAKEGLRESTAAAERDLRPMVAQALGQLDLLAQDFDAATGAAPSPAVGRTATRTTPGSVTRGSGTGDTKRRTPSRKPRRRVKSVRRRPGR